MGAGRIVITGVGPISPLGLGRAELSAALGEGLEPAELGELHVEDYLTSAKTYLDPNSAQALCSTALALADARLRLSDSLAASVGFSFGTRLGNVTTVESYLKMVREQGVKLASPLLFIHSYPNTSVSLTSIEFGIRGTSFNFNSGRFSGLQALIQAADELWKGKMSVMLAGASDTYTEVTRATAAGEPFAAAVTLVAEGVQAARRRGVEPLVEVAGCGLAGSAAEAFSRALREAATARAEIDWLLADAPPAEPTATGTRIHTTALRELTGDCGAATALIGVTLAAVVMGEGKLPVGLGLTELPHAAAVVSADDSGAAAVILRKLAG